MNKRQWREDVRKRIGGLTQVSPPKPLHVHIHCKGEPADDWGTIQKLYSEKGVIVHVHIYDTSDSPELERILGTHVASMDEMEQALEAQYEYLSRIAPD
jgi:hypothetical protein